MISKYPAQSRLPKDPNMPPDGFYWVRWPYSERWQPAEVEHNSWIALGDEGYECGVPSEFKPIKEQP